MGLDYGIASTSEKLKPAEHEASALLHFALDSGISLIDTARAYGESERIIGRALNGRRSEFILLSKIRPGTREDVRRQAEESLRDLQSEVIDMMMIHAGAEQVLTDEETTVELQRQRELGRIRFIGASVYGPDAALAAIDSGWFDCLEIAYSVLDRRPERGVLEAARRADIGIIARSVLLKGALTARCKLLPETLASLKQCVRQLAAVAGSIDRLPGLAYRYVLGNEPPHSVLAGTSSLKELTECMAYAREGPLSAQQLDAIRAVQLDDDRWANPGNWPT